MTIQAKWLVAAAATSVLAIGAAHAQKPPFGQDEDTAYAAKVWSKMKDMKLAGDGAIQSFPYAGSQPHGAMLESFYENAEIEGHSGSLIVKRNYGPEDVTKDQVMEDPSGHLLSVTVMVKREDGYDPENQNWFWAKFKPDGTLEANPKGLSLAGRVVKGNSEAGCIACHTGAPGGDYLFTTDRVDW